MVRWQNRTISDSTEFAEGALIARLFCWGESLPLPSDDIVRNLCNSMFDLGPLSFADKSKLGCRGMLQRVSFNAWNSRPQILFRI